MKTILSTIKHLSLIPLITSQVIAGLHMANGIKVGEVNADSAIVWTRLTANPERNTDGAKFEHEAKGKKKLRAKAQPIYENLSMMQGSVAGTEGEIRVTYWPTSDTAAKRSTEWQSVYPENDYIHQFKLEELKYGTTYSLLVEGKNRNLTSKLEGGFRTAPCAEKNADIRFVVTTCGDYPRRDDDINGHRIYNQMLSLDPDFFVHTGDIEYYDKPFPYAVNLELARFKWNRIYSMPFLRTFHNQVASYFIKDDHDTTKNDAWPGQDYFDLTWEQGLATFREQVPMGEKTYRTIRWGKHLQVWLVEGRDFRSPNTMPDGPEKTIWGAEQKQWFFDTVRASDATFKVLLSPTPVVGPDRLKGKNDNHSNAAFATEGNEIRAFLAAQSNMYVVCGDRHWQYASIDPQTGLREFSCGPASDMHASGYKEDYYGEMHRFLRIKGGFLRVDIDGANDTIHFRHHAVDGSIVNEESFQADSSRVASCEW